MLDTSRGEREECLGSRAAGASLSWLERRPVTPEVAGSSPVAPAIDRSGPDRATRTAPVYVLTAYPISHSRLGDEHRLPARLPKRCQLGLSMDNLLRDYFPILVFLAIAGGIATAMVTASLLVARQRPDRAKLSPYECGFEPFDDARIRFDVRYYLVAILFIIFDLEVAFLFPWAVSLADVGAFGFWSMIVFLGVLTIGFIYEWKKGALEWE